MNFLNAVLLGGIAAGLVPLVIHLFHRTRFKTVEWGAMHLLDVAEQIQTRRLQWDSWLLLLIRCLIPILMAVALARPVLTYLRVAGSDSPPAMVLLLDDSFSMDAGGHVPNQTDNLGDGDSLLERAKQAAEEIAQAAGPTAQIHVASLSQFVADISQPPTPSSNEMRAKFKQTLQNLRGGSDAGQPFRALEQALAYLRAQPRLNRQLILLSDFQSSRYQTASLSTTSRNSGLVNLTASGLSQSREVPSATSDEPTSGAPQACQVLLWPLATPTTAKNLAVQIIGQSTSLVRVHEPLTVTAKITNYGKRTVEDIAVVFSVDDRALSSRLLTLAGGAVETVDFACELTQLGWHHAEVRITDSSSSIHADDRAHQVWRAIQPPRVWLCDPYYRPGSFSGSASYVQLALAPFTAQDRQPNPFVCQVVPPERLQDGELEIDVLVLAGIKRLNERAAVAVEQFVRDGGGLLFLAGHELDIQWSNRHWGQPQGLLPFCFVEESQADELRPARIRSLPAGRYPAQLQGVEVHRWWRMQPADGAAQAESAANAELKTSVPERPGGDSHAETNTEMKMLDKESKPKLHEVLLQVSTGDPLLATQSFGAGRVLQMAISTDEQASNLALQPSFVPLIQSLVESVVPQQSSTNELQAGQPIELVLNLSTSHQARGDELQIKRLFISRSTSESSHPLEVMVHNGRAVVEQTWQPGLYRVGSDGKVATSSLVDPPLFVVPASESESQPELLSISELEQLAQVLGGTVIESVEDYLALQQVRRDGRELWRPVLLAVLGLLFLELFLQQRITRGGGL